MMSDDPKILVVEGTITTEDGVTRKFLIHNTISGGPTWIQWAASRESTGHTVTAMDAITAAAAEFLAVRR